jgi:hypothetical protein
VISGVHIFNISPADRARKESAPAHTGIESEHLTGSRPGDLVFKPRGLPHAFWNAGDAPPRALEIISPSGFERYFAEMASLLPPNHPGPPDVQALLVVQEKYGLEMDMASIPTLAERHGLVTGEPPA